jgi:hypothetical protein
VTKRTYSGTWSKRPGEGNDGLLREALLNKLGVFKEELARRAEDMLLAFVHHEAGLMEDCDLVEYIIKTFPVTIERQ